MNAARLIEKKRDGHALSADEIGFLVEGFTAGRIPDYQMAAWSMAVYFQGMDATETAALTQHMLHSGRTLQWPDSSPPRVDKHSTGGVGDKISLLLAPLLACCDVRVPMISGRGLGATGGTLDKFESIPGLRTHLTREELQRQVERVGCAIAGASEDIAPADRRLYALRDVTGTVPSIPLITASILSKKLAESLDALVLDVKFGSGAFMKTLPDARRLAESLVSTGRRMGVPTTALLTDMNQPLGRMVGNAVEVLETLDCLRGEGPEDVVELTIALGAELLQRCGRAERQDAGKETREDAERQLREHLDSGRALEKFRALVAAQGGDPEAPLAIAPARPYTAPRDGYLASIDAQRLGEAVIHLGGGRRQVGDRIDHSVGLEMLARLGDRVEREQPLVRVFSHQPLDGPLRQLLDQALIIGPDSAEPPPLIRETLAE